MSQESIRDPKAFAQIVENTLQKAQEHISGLRRTNTWLLITSIVSSTVTSLVAGGTAAAGPVIGEGIAGWRLACIVAAIFAALSTASTALTQQLKTNERLLQGTECVGRLKALAVSIATGSQSWEEIGKEYGDIVRVYPEIG